MAMAGLLISVFLCFFPVIYSLDNGLALTPPMGWLTWQRFRCTTDCETYPEECISEWLIMNMTDLLESDGYLDAGYEYIIIDDCWLNSDRDSDGRLEADPSRFPSGIGKLADYVHSKGLKFGIYEDFGTKTCAGFPGSQDHLEIDANTFAEWGVDYLKFDGCNSSPDDQMKGSGDMAKALNSTGRPILFSCEFPLYQGPDNADFTAAAEYCNLWRTSQDIDDSHDSFRGIVQFYIDHADKITSAAGPGHWNDPDMLIIGNYGLSYEQSKAQMTIWSILASPLIMSTDLRTIEPEMKDILLNKNAIRINQDELGMQGHLHTTIDNIEVWMRMITPKIGDEFSYALGFVSKRTDGYGYRLEVTLDQFAIDSSYQYTIQDVFEPDQSIGAVDTSTPFEVRVKPTGAVFLLITLEEN